MFEYIIMVNLKFIYGKYILLNIRIVLLSNYNIIILLDKKYVY